ncbi:IS3 family transposase [Streptomyces sp. NBRC 110028]|uniref:IS3 family transposase n=1 Tax=Streptomyces sp. NBRC 110028 TaxID=1621260 RepID=UPI000AB1C0D0|nr:IS3 family transposase [Streptomyces sp. NBRC 110028]
MKNYPPQFKADAVALYQSRPGATIRQVAADLGINPETLRNWVRAAGASRPRGRRATSTVGAADAVGGGERRSAQEGPRAGGGTRDPAQGGQVFRRGDALVNRFQFVADHHRRYGVKRGCTILGIARSSFSYWRRTAADRAVRQAADARLATRIRAVHRESDGTYGVPRITAELREAGERVNHKRIARVMRGAGLAGVRLRRRHRTTVADPAAAKAPDLVGRDFTASEPNTKYVGDITYLPLDGGRFLYLATVIDLASPRLAGWAIADHMRTDLVTDALAAAEQTRGSLAGAVLHLDLEPPAPALCAAGVRAVLQRSSATSGHRQRPSSAPVTRADHRSGPDRQPRHTKTRAPRRHPPRIPTCRMTWADEVSGKRRACAWSRCAS